MKVFTYGTLKSSYHNNYILSDSSARLVGQDLIPGFRLYYSGGQGSFPVAVRDENYLVSGEIWDISNNPDHILARLDRLEGVPMLYIRERFKTVGDHEVSMYTIGPMFRGHEHLEPVPDINQICNWSR